MIHILLDAPPPPQNNQPQKPPHSVEDEVREALDCIESGYRSDVEWIMLSKLYKELLNSPKRTPRMESLIEMMKPTMSKYGYHGTEPEGK